MLSFICSTLINIIIFFEFNSIARDVGDRSSNSLSYTYSP